MCVCACVLSCPALCDPWTAARQSSTVHGNSPDKNPGVGCHFLLQGVFLTQGLDPHLLCRLHCRQILYHWATREAQLGVTVLVLQMRKSRQRETLNYLTRSQAKRQSPALAKASAFFSTLILYEEFRMGQSEIPPENTDLRAWHTWEPVMWDPFPPPNISVLKIQAPRKNNLTIFFSENTQGGDCWINQILSNYRLSNFIQWITHLWNNHHVPFLGHTSFWVFAGKELDKSHVSLWEAHNSMRGTDSK